MIKLFKKKTPRVVKNFKISVVMPVFLGNYENCAADREEKLIKAIKSFQEQTYQNKELVIVADGCSLTEKIVKNLSNQKNIVFKKIKKQPLFSGKVRYEGVKLATGELICYLDSDDYHGKHHLSTISNAFKSNTELDWVYYNDLILPPHRTPVTRIVELKKGFAGTSCMAHRKTCKATWKGCDKYNHDWLFIEQLMKNNPNYTKIFGAEYYVCHIVGIF